MIKRIRMKKTGFNKWVPWAEDIKESRVGRWQTGPLLEGDQDIKTNTLEEKFPRLKVKPSPVRGRGWVRYKAPRAISAGRVSTIERMVEC